jgi:glycosyltransferase involved in cell wall biosynthesis
VKFSIITPSLNGRRYLEQTAHSILSQQVPFDLEWLVMDGGSTDGTIELLRSLDQRRVRWRSDPDRGQSHAINMGLELATGDVIGWLGADDLYTPGALAAVAEAFERNRSAQWLTGRYEIIGPNGAVIRSAVARYKERSLRRYSYRALLRENFISQPAVFWRREFGQRVGPLDETLYYTMDYDLWLRMGRESDPLFLDRVLAQFRLHQSSKTGQARRAQFDEQYRVACRYSGGDRMSRWAHRFNVEKIVWAYRVMRLFGI